MPAVKKTPAKKAVQKTVTYSPLLVDPKIDALAKRFAATTKAMSAKAAQIVTAYHAGKLEVPVGEYTYDTDYYSAVYPVLQLADYVQLQWELMKFLTQHAAAPTKRNEKLVLDRREKLLDLLDNWEIAPLNAAIKQAPTAVATRKAQTEYYAARAEQRRVRLGLTKAEFAKRLITEKAEYEALRAKDKAEDEARQAAAEVAAEAQRAKLQALADAKVARQAKAAAKKATDKAVS